MDVQIAAASTDDPDFIELLNALLRGLLTTHVPAELWIIQIDNWFDRKWLQFSGLGIVDFQWHGLINRFDAALDEFYQDRLTFPPFPPNRVLGQWSYVKGSVGYTEAPLPILPHPTQRRRSEQNLQRRVQDFSQSACFLWYSSNTRANGKGSVMVYRTEAHKVENWFATFNRDKSWTLHATKGASRNEVQQLLTAV
jgi:hypothetical protein